MVIATRDTKFVLKLEEFASPQVLEDGVVNLSLAIMVFVVLKVLHRVEVLEIHGLIELNQMRCIHVLCVKGDLIRALKPASGC